MKVTAKLKKEIRAEIERMFGRKMLVEVGEIYPIKSDYMTVKTSYNQINFKDGEWDLWHTYNLSWSREWDDIDGEIWLDLWIYNRTYFGQEDSIGLIDNAYMTIKDGAITHSSLSMDKGWQRSTAN